MQFHGLPVESGRLTRQAIPQILLLFTICSRSTTGNEARHSVLTACILPAFIGAPFITLYDRIAEGATKSSV